jgi:Monoamine oxidase
MIGPITMFGPDFPFAYDEFLSHQAGLGQIPAAAHGTEIAIIGAGIAGIVAGHELMKLGLKPVLYESDRIGGRLRSEPFKDGAGAYAELGAMRFPPSSRALFHYFDKVGIETVGFPNPLAPDTPSTVIELAGVRHYARTKDDLPKLFTEVERAWAEALEEGAHYTELTTAIRHRDTGTIRRLWHHLVENLDEESFLRLHRQIPLLPRTRLSRPRSVRSGRVRHRRLGYRLPQFDPRNSPRRRHRRG